MEIFTKSLELEAIRREQKNIMVASRIATDAISTFCDREAEAAACDEALLIAQSTRGWRGVYTMPGTERTNNQPVILGFEAFSRCLTGHFGLAIDNPLLGGRDFHSLFTDYKGDRVDYLTWLVRSERRFVLGCNIAEEVEGAPLMVTWTLAKYHGTATWKIVNYHGGVKRRR